MVRRRSIPPVERFTQDLELHSGGYLLARTTQDGPVTSEPRLLQFTFDLCRKTSQFGDVAVDQVWMEHATVYGQRNCRSTNHDALVDAFWTLCWREGSVLEDAVQESYLLAKLVTESRSNGSRRVFQDAVQAQGTNAQRQRLIQALDQRLAAGRRNELDMVAFRDQTAILLGPPSYPAEVWDRYRRYGQELFEEGRAALARGLGADGALARWQNWMSGVARRRGNDLDKQVLDIFSYESRAALHRCYSAVWFELLPVLADRFGFSELTTRFHNLWHLEQSMPSDDPRANFHLFHGHIFGLHPGTYLFAQTRTGGELIGDALAEPGLGPAFGRLLNGLMIAIYEFADRSQAHRDGRRGRSAPWSGALDDTLQYEQDFSIHDE